MFEWFIDYIDNITAPNLITLDWDINTGKNGRVLIEFPVHADETNIIRNYFLFFPE